MYNPHAFACERNNSSRIRKQEVGFRLSEPNALRFIAPVFTTSERAREREKETSQIPRERVNGEREYKYIYIYIYRYNTFIYISIYKYICRERER